MINVKKLFTPKVLSAMAIGGVVLTAVFAALDGSEAKETVEALREDPVKEDEKPLETVMRVLPGLGPKFLRTIVTASGTIICIVLACHMSAAQLSMMAGSCLYLAKNRNAAEKKIEELGGKEAVAKFKESFAIKQIEQSPNRGAVLDNIYSVEYTGNGDLLCLEGYSGRWFYSNEDAVREAYDRIADRYDEGEMLSENDLYDELNICRSQFGSYVGYPNNDWYASLKGFVNFRKIHDDNLGRDVLICERVYGYFPTENYMEAF